MNLFRERQLNHETKKMSEFLRKEQQAGTIEAYLLYAGTESGRSVRCAGGKLENLLTLISVALLDLIERQPEEQQDRLMDDIILAIRGIYDGWKEEKGKAEKQ